MDLIWEPGNEVERELLRALEAGDGGRFAKAVLSAPLFLPVLPKRDSPEGKELMLLLPWEEEHVLAYTCAETLSDALGPYTDGYTETTYAALAAAWPEGSALKLALNPGLPIAAALPIEAIHDLAEGRRSLIPSEDVEQLVLDELRKQIRASALTALGCGRAAVLVSVPGSPLEAALTEAVRREDHDGYLAALMNGEVVALTSRPVPPGMTPGADGFPWRILGTPRSPVIALFSSTATLDRVAPQGQHHVTVPFLALLADWPDENHALCLDPGAETELILTGEGMYGLRAAVAGILAEDAEDVAR
ncbi:SseB family protein [Amycolatopsis rhizosphaerae]|uniref:SseB family protein n=1 Tax=Amycolatopsis rhizosphaerae TaxID=2053003 RepID=A0A558DC92_9PSEU|nr:SseB family protein [Amycolatopsis rhizosphaerae]TVT58645.1 SseB family protein [Amycolatopsis rhizosphaerae]